MRQFLPVRRLQLRRSERQGKKEDLEPQGHEGTRRQTLTAETRRRGEGIGGGVGSFYGAAEGGFSLIGSGHGDSFRADARGPSRSTANRAATNRPASGSSYAAAKLRASS